MARTWQVFVGSILSIFVLVGDTLAGVQVPWYEDQPAVSMDYKVHIDAGKEDCYFQYAHPGATFYASYQVLKGGDGMCGFAVRHPNGQIVHPYEWQQTGEYVDKNSAGGYYSVCIDNQFSRFAGKLVNLYLSVVRYDRWEQFSKEIMEMDMNIQNFTSSITNVERNINDMLQHQYHSRAKESRDMNVLEANKSYVMKWSLVQIVAVVATTAFQVYFLRKLFEVRDGSSRSRI